MISYKTSNFSCFFTCSLFYDLWKYVSYCVHDANWSKIYNLNIFKNLISKIDILLCKFFTMESVHNFMKVKKYLSLNSSIKIIEGPWWFSFFKFYMINILNYVRLSFAFKLYKKGIILLSKVWLNYFMKRIKN